MPYKNRNCLECGLEYSPNSSTQKYCFSCGKKKDKEYQKEYKQRPEVKQKDRERQRIRRQRPEVKKKGKVYQKKYWKKNKEDLNKKNKERRENNIEVYKERDKEYCKNHREQINKRLKKKWKINKNFNIRMRLGHLLRYALSTYTKTGKTMNSKKYGIDWGAVIEYLKPFPEDISNYHIDHIKPLCSFNLEDPEEIKRAFAPENHQWLLAEENLVKGGRYRKV